MLEQTIRVKITVSDGNKGQIVIDSEDGKDIPMFMLRTAAEHLMTAVAVQHRGGFEQAIKLMCAGARAARVQYIEQGNSHSSEKIQ